MDHATKKKPHPKRTRHQGASGRVVLDADFSARRSDVMVVQGGGWPCRTARCGR